MWRRNRPRAYWVNVYAEVDLEMKAKALAKCEVEEEGQAQKPRREDKGLMEFLRTV